jgi:hypothetical protein
MSQRLDVHADKMMQISLLIVFRVPRPTSQWTASCTVSKNASFLGPSFMELPSSLNWYRSYPIEDERLALYFIFQTL